MARSRRIVSTVALAAVALVAVLLATDAIIRRVKWHTQYTSQMRNMREAEAFAPTIGAHLADNSVFEMVGVGPYTGNGGCIQVYGYVASAEDLATLKGIVLDTNPPLPIHYQVTIVTGLFNADSTDPIRSNDPTKDD